MASILVIEDNPANLELMTYLLRSSGHTVLTAMDGAAGCELAQREQPMLVICDIHLPKMDGYQVVRYLKAIPALRMVPVIAVTALAMVGDRERGIAAGFDGYIYKPIEPTTFVAEVEYFLHIEQRGESPAAGSENSLGPELHGEGKLAKVLVVDDSPVNLELMRTLLEPFDYDISLAISVTEAMEVALIHKHDLIISDLHMPGQDGFALLLQVKESEALREIPFVIITSTAWGEKYREKSLQLGATRFILRPIEPQALLAEIAACLAQAS